jgi:hypothetical protein
MLEIFARNQHLPIRMCLDLLIHTISMGKL